MSASPHRPVIGVFDSGFGGLTVLRALLPLRPGAHFVYLGDTARLPYGAKSHATIARYATSAAAFLLAQGAEMLVVACNTASALALPEIQAALPIPVVGVIEPGTRAAASLIHPHSHPSTPPGAPHLAPEMWAEAAHPPEALPHPATQPGAPHLAPEMWAEAAHPPEALSHPAIQSGAPHLAPEMWAEAAHPPEALPHPGAPPLAPEMWAEAAHPSEAFPHQATPPGAPHLAPEMWAEAAHPSKASPQILVLATAATVQSGAYTRSCAALGLAAYEKACPLLVPLVEEGWTGDNPATASVTAQVLRIYLAEALAAAPTVSTLVLGCTHYPLLKPLIERTLLELGHPLRIVDSASATALAASAILPPAPPDPNPVTTCTFFATDSIEKFQRLGSAFLGQALPPVQLVDLGG